VKADDLLNGVISAMLAGQGDSFSSPVLNNKSYPNFDSGSYSDVDASLNFLGQHLPDQTIKLLKKLSDEGKDPWKGWIVN
jgi:hypothetical protein